MLRSANAEVREDAGGVLGAVGRDEAVVDAVLESLVTETEQQTTDSLVQALGQMRAERAIPALARIIRDVEGDGDTRFTAAEALGQIVRRRFVAQPNTIDAASRWLEGHGF